MALWRSGSLALLPEIKKNFQGTIAAVHESVEGLLDITKRKTMGNDRTHVDTSLGNPLHGQGKVDSKIGTDAGNNREIFPKQLPQ